MCILDEGVTFNNTMIIHDHGHGVDSASKGGGSGGGASHLSLHAAMSRLRNMTLSDTFSSSMERIFQPKKELNDMNVLLKCEQAILKSET